MTRTPGPAAEPELLSGAHKPSLVEQRAGDGRLLAHRDPHVQSRSPVGGHVVVGERGDQRLAPGRVGLAGAGHDRVEAGVEQQLGRGRLQDVTDPARPQRLPSLDAGDRRRVAGDEGNPQVGVEHLRERSDHRPARPRAVGEGPEGRSRDQARVVVLDDQNVAMGCQQRPQFAGARFVDGRAQRILGAGHGHDRLRSAVEGRSEPVGDQPGVVDGDGDRHEAQGQQHVTDRRIAGVLDDHPVARPQMGAQHPLDAVHRPRHDGQRLRGNPVGLEPRTGCVEQVGIGGLQPRDARASRRCRCAPAPGRCEGSSAGSASPMLRSARAGTGGGDPPRQGLGAPVVVPPGSRDDPRRPRTRARAASGRRS